jgi:hypothetical protein
MQALVDAAGGKAPADAALAARVAALDPSFPPLQAAAVAIASAAGDRGRREAATAAMAAVTSHALGRLPASAPVGIVVDPLAGRLTDALTNPRLPR